MLDVGVVGWVVLGIFVFLVLYVAVRGGRPDYDDYMEEKPYIPFERLFAKIWRK